MYRPLVGKAKKFLESFKLEFPDKKMEQDYWTLKTENTVKDFKICLEFLILFNVLVAVLTAISETWADTYNSGGTAVLLFFVYCLRKRLTKYIEFATLIITFSYDISRLFMVQSSFKASHKSFLFHAGYGLANIQGILLFRLLRVSQKSIGAIVLLALRYLVLSLYIDPGSFPLPLFIRHCFIDGYVVYTLYNQEASFRKVYRDFMSKKEELLKFKEFLAESLPQSLVVISYTAKSYFFSNKAFQNTFHVLDDFNSLDNQLKTLLVDRSTIRETATNNFRLNFTNDSKAPLSLSEIIKKFDSQDCFIDKTISFSTTQNDHGMLYEITVKKVKWDNKDAIAVLFNDITYQENLIALKMANMNKDKVIATVSHELRTPLNGIIGILDITKKKVEKPEIAEYLSLCKDNAYLLLSLVNSILDLQQISAGKLKLNPTNLDIRKVVNSISQLFYFQCKEKNISLDYDIHQDVPTCIFTDENRLKQVLINLVGNAIKFTSKGGVRIEVSPYLEASDSLQISVTDSGIGIKKQDQKRLFKMYSKIEDGETVNKNGVGLGLTISNALVVLLNGGIENQAINVHSAYGIGTKFYFQIHKNLKEKTQTVSPKSEMIEDKTTLSPALNFSNSTKGMLLQKSSTSDKEKAGEDFLNFEDHDFDEFLLPPDLQSKITSYANLKYTNTFTVSRLCSDDAHIRKGSSLMKGLHGALNSIHPFQKQTSVYETIRSDLNILIVDDNPFNLLVAKSLIEEFGCKVKTALGGEEAIQLIKTNHSEEIKFRAIFMDCQMPIMDGFETTKAIRTLIKNGEISEMPIYGWTANNSEEDVKRCYVVGMLGTIPKPASKSDFWKVIAELK